MKLKVKDLDIATGGTLVTILNKNDAEDMDLHVGDRVEIKSRKAKITAVVDVAVSERTVPEGRIGMFEELIAKSKVKNNEEVKISIVEKPESVSFIKKKLYNHELKPQEIYKIICDMVNNNLTSIEISYFVAGSFINGMTLNETVALTKAMINTGERLRVKRHPIVDKHCIGGVAGNRTTCIVVPIIAALGLCMPKTSSRSITSPAGTADTMEVITNVSLTKDKIQKVVNKIGACLAWGGAVDLAPADDRIINVEHPLALDVEAQLLASILAKKGSVGASHVLIDIPIGKGSKIYERKRALHLKRKFEEIGRQLGMVITVVITDGRQPIGNGIGPSLEARDVLWLLKNDPRAPQDLKKKAIFLASELIRCCKNKINFNKLRKYKIDPKMNSRQIAKYVLESGMAFKKFKEIVHAQGKKILDPKKIQTGKYKFNYLSRMNSKIVHLDNKVISKIARIAGAPKDKGAGIYLYKHVGDIVKRREQILTIYAQSRQKLKYAKEFLKRFDGVIVR